MRSITWSGTLTARTSIAHAGPDLSTVHTFRREHLLCPDGRQLDMPIISGGVVRGAMRRKAAKMTQQALVGDGTLVFDVVHTLMSGGSLRETRTSGEVLTGERQAQLRSLVPALAIFGFATSGRIVSGRLNVGKVIPLTAETAWLAPSYGIDPAVFGPLPTASDIVQEEDSTRFADANTGIAQHLVSANTTPLEMPKGGGNMIWCNETLIPGTRLMHTLTLDGGTPLEVSFMDDLVRYWSKDGVIGGQKGRGCGRISVDYQRTCEDILGDPADDEPTVDWRQHMHDHHDEIMEVLTWL